jgi:hypothetical protein
VRLEEIAGNLKTARTVIQKARRAVRTTRLAGLGKAARLQVRVTIL